MYFHTDDDNTVQRLANDIMAACANRQKVRILTDGNGSLKYKIGEGMWSEPIHSTPDPYRDKAVERGVWRHDVDGSPCASYPDSFNWTYTTESHVCAQGWLLRMERI